MGEAPYREMLLKSVLVLSFAWGCWAVQDPVVSVEQGALRGTVQTTIKGREVFAFLGVPYARPPSLKHRFKEAVPPAPWSGVYNARMHPSACMQYSHDTYTTDMPVFGSEDCLYLNVYTPKLPSNDSASPLMDVLVYIHGGAFMFSYGGHHGPRYLLDRDVVLVTLQYRLGPLGFLSTGDDVLPGNNGLKDQVTALKWLRSNIAAFGGDPDRVTLSGTSAGGASVHFHYLSPLSRGLFKGGVSMSGTALNCWTHAENARAKALRIGEELGCPTNNTKELVRCLRTRPAASIVGLSKLFMPWMYNPYSPFGPVVESPVISGAFITEPPVDAILGGRAQDSPWMVTFTSHEGLYPGAEIVSNPKAINELEDSWEEILPSLLDFRYTTPKGLWTHIAQLIRSRYLKGKTVSEAVPEVVEMLGDRLFVGDIAKAAKLQANASASPVYSYKFSYRGKHSASEKLSNNLENYGTSHADDTGYFLERTDTNPEETEEDRNMIEAMSDMITTFMSTGTPTFGAEAWVPVKEGLPQFAYKDIDSPNSGRTVKSADAGNQDFWDSLGFVENVPTVQTVAGAKDEL